MSRIDDEAAVLDSETGVYYGLNPMATRMIDELLSPSCASTSAFAALLAEEYEATADLIEKDLADLVRTLVEKNLIVETLDAATR